MHARLGINDLVCVESEEDVHKRQNFNRPIDHISCIHSTLEEYLDENDFEKPVIIWLDYTEPSDITDQIQRFARTTIEVPFQSILRVTLNANPGSLGKPAPDDVSVENSAGIRSSNAPTIQEWRLERLRERLGALFPSELQSGDMTYKTFGRALLKTLSIAVERELLSYSDRTVIWSLATHYADGQPMITATLIVVPKGDTTLSTVVSEWEYVSSPEAPLLLDMPSLSTLERLTMESCEDPKTKLDFKLPRSDMGGDPFESFKRFYRVFPHFSRVEI
jgi:hypothetical protein